MLPNYHCSTTSQKHVLPLFASENMDVLFVSCFLMAVACDGYIGHSSRVPAGPYCCVLWIVHVLSLAKAMFVYTGVIFFGNHQSFHNCRCCHCCLEFDPEMCCFPVVLMKPKMRLVSMWRIALPVLFLHWLFQNGLHFGGLVLILTCGCQNCTKIKHDWNKKT